MYVHHTLVGIKASGRQAVYTATPTVNILKCKLDKDLVILLKTVRKKQELIIVLANKRITCILLRCCLKKKKKKKKKKDAHSVHFRFIHFFHRSLDFKKETSLAVHYGFHNTAPSKKKRCMLYNQNTL